MAKKKYKAEPESFDKSFDAWVKFGDSVEFLTVTGRKSWEEFKKAIKKKKK